MAKPNAYEPLRLTAADADDLGVVSAVLQDAVGKLGDFAYLPRERRFAFVVNRFVWETAGERRVGPFARVRAGCHFNDVAAVRARNVRLGAGDAVVSLLSMAFEPGEDGAGKIALSFAGGGAIELDVESVNAGLRDLSEPWPTRSRPKHEA